MEQMIWSNSRYGAEIYEPRNNHRESIHLEKLATVFQAEVMTIHRCVETLLTRADANHWYRICSDSKAALDPLNKITTESSVVWDCMLAVNRLGESHEVTLVWVPGHQGNETSWNTYRPGGAGRRYRLCHGKKHHQRLVRERTLKLLETNQRMQMIQVADGVAPPSTAEQVSYWL